MLISKTCWRGLNMTIEYFEGTNNPFVVYKHSEGYETDGRWHKHKKQIAKYADLASALYLVFDKANQKGI